MNGTVCAIFGRLKSIEEGGSSKTVGQEMMEQNNVSATTQ